MKELMAKLAEQNVEFIDLKLSDLGGKLHHITFPLARLETAIDQGIGFDGSSLGGFRDIAESDLIVRPDLSKYWIDPFYEYPTASFYGDIYERQLRPQEAEQIKKQEARITNREPAVMNPA